MDTTNRPTSTTSRSKFSKTFHKVIPFKKSSTKSLSNNNGFCLLLPHDNKFKNSDSGNDPKRHFNKLVDNAELRNKAAMEAFVAKLFATISSLKAAYAELQAAQFPYNGDAVQCADQGVVDELKAISEMKRSFLKKQIDSSPPHVTLLLSEMQEQQSLMKMYEITMNKMEREIKTKDFEVFSLKKHLVELESTNKSLELKINSSGCFPVLDNVKLSDLTATNFVTVLHYTLRSLRNFVKLLVRDMVNAHWDIDTAVKAIEPNVVYSKPCYKCFAIESYVTREMFDGFNENDDNEDRFQWFNRFKKMKSISTMQVLKENPRSAFGKFTRAKYMRLVHPKMEASLYGNLSQRKTLNTWQFPDTAFFSAFTEMARRVWVLRCLAGAFEKEVSVFQVRKGCRFSEVYMESVTDDGGGVDELRVAFTVVPGFKIGETVVQSQVYVMPGRR